MKSFWVSVLAIRFIDVSFWLRARDGPNRLACAKIKTSFQDYGLKVVANEETLLRNHCCSCVSLCHVSVLCARKLRNICCGHKMFLNKIRNNFCVPDTKFVSATNVARAGKRVNICIGSNASATMCPRLPVTLVPRGQN